MKGSRFNSGLSPRVRGNRTCPINVRQRKGSIPACAGEPPRGAGSTGRSAVYPRVCGGTVSIPRAATRIPGLSPRVRGNHALAPASTR